MGPSHERALGAPHPLPAPQTSGRQATPRLPRAGSPPVGPRGLWPAMLVMAQGKCVARGTFMDTSILAESARGIPSKRFQCAIARGTSDTRWNACYQRGSGI